MAKRERLVHYSEIPVLRVNSTAQSSAMCGHNAWKPKGFWLSVDSADHNWRDWCESEEYGLDRLTHVHDVKLHPMAILLRLSTFDQLLEFTNKYGIRQEWPRDTAINWGRVALGFDGIIIAPYVWKARLAPETFWYYSWDCSSGCIWNGDVVAEIRLRRSLATVPKRRRAVA